MGTLYTAKTSTTTIIPAKAGVGLLHADASYSLSAALALNDVIQMVKVPSGAKILELVLAVDSLDSSTGVVLDVGDGEDVDRFVDGATIGRSGAGGFVRLGQGVTTATAATNSMLYTYPEDDTIDVLVQVAPSGTAATTGKISMSVFYTLAQ